MIVALILNIFVLIAASNDSWLIVDLIATLLAM